MNVDMTDLFILKKKLFFRLTFVLVNKTIMSCVNNTIMSFVNNKTLNSIDMVGARHQAIFKTNKKKLKCDKDIYQYKHAIHLLLLLCILLGWFNTALFCPCPKSESIFVLYILCFDAYDVTRRCGCSKLVSPSKFQMVDT